MVNGSRLIMNLRLVFKTVFVLFVIYFTTIIVFENVPFLNRIDFHVIITETMAPTINAGDTVIINDAVSFDDLVVDDLVAIKVDVNGEPLVLTHYVYSINHEDRTLLTRSTSQSIPDNWVINEANYLGRYLVHVPWIGRFLVFAGTPIGRIIIIVDILLIYLLYRWFFKKDSGVNSQAAFNEEV